MQVDEENLSIKIGDSFLDFDEESYVDDKTINIVFEEFKKIENLEFDFINFNNAFFLTFNSPDGFKTSLFYESELVKETNSNEIKLIFNCREPNKYWEGKWGLSTFLSTLYSFIIDDNAITVEDFNIEDDWKILEIGFLINEKTFVLKKIIEEKAKIINEYIFRTERFLSGKIWLDEYEKNEKLFCTDILLPLLRKMQFLDVKFTHGTREYGKDFTFSELTSFGNLRHFALQAKAGNIRGNVNSEIDEIVGQLDDAFSIPYFEITANEERTINTFIVAISGYFTDNAKDKIAHKVPKNLRGSVYFLDKDKILELIEKYL